MKFNLKMLNQTTNGEDLYLDHSDVPEIIVITCILSVFSLVGTTGNAFVLYVFSRKRDKNTSTVFILALAATDFLTCLFIIPFTIVFESLYKHLYYDTACKVYQFFITSNVPFSAFIMVAIAFDRYFCICRPWMKFLDIRFAKRIILALLVFAISLGLITCLAYGVYHHRDIYFEITDISAMTQEVNNVANSSSLSDERLVRIYEEALRNYSNGNQSLNNSLEPTLYKSTILSFTGFCYPNELIIGVEFRKVYQTFYASLFLIAFITVLILYALIYKSILARRSKRLRTSVAQRHYNGRRSTLLTSVLMRQSNISDKKTVIEPEFFNNQTDKNAQHLEKANSVSNVNGIDSECPKIVDTKRGVPVTELNGDKPIQQTNNVTKLNDLKTTPGKPRKLCVKAIKNTNHHARFRDNTDHLKVTDKHQSEIEKDESRMCDAQENNQATQTVTIYRKDTRKSVREKHRIANIKTAGILFIVTLVFILAFLPAWLMATKIIDANMIVFYMYFSYNVVNPVIYAFFNHSFQKEVKYMLKCRKRYDI